MTGLQYIGRGEFLPGIPARDLSAEEIEQHGGAAFLLATGLYQTYAASAEDSAPAAKPAKRGKG